MNCSPGSAQPPPPVSFAVASVCRLTTLALNSFLVSVAYGFLYFKLNMHLNFSVPILLRISLCDATEQWRSTLAHSVSYLMPRA